eukprot:993441-Prymnesium_polylepis.1
MTYEQQPKLAGFQCELRWRAALFESQNLHSALSTQSAQDRKDHDGEQYECENDEQHDNTVGRPDAQHALRERRVCVRKIFVTLNHDAAHIGEDEQKAGCAREQVVFASA